MSLGDKERLKITLGPGESVTVTSAPTPAEIPLTEQQRKLKIKAEMHLRKFASANYEKIDELRGEEHGADSMLLMDKKQEVEDLIDELNAANLGRDHVVDVTQRYLSGYPRNLGPLEISGFSQAYAGFLEGARVSMAGKKPIVSTPGPTS